MERNILNLIEIVEKESETLTSLCEILFQQKEAAIKREVEGLNQLTDAQNLLYARLAELESKRLRWIAPLAQELALQPQEVTLSMIEKRFAVTGQNRLAEASNSLKPVLNKVKRMLKSNAMIFSRCLQLGEERLQLLLNFRNRQEIYSLKGKKAKSGKKSGIILNKQF